MKEIMDPNLRTSVLCTTWEKDYSQKAEIPEQNLFNTSSSLNIKQRISHLYKYSLTIIFSESMIKKSQINTLYIQISYESVLNELKPSINQ